MRRVHDKTQPFVFIHRIAIHFLIESQQITESRAAAPLHSHPEHQAGIKSRISHQSLNFCNGAGRKQQGRYIFRFHKYKNTTTRYFITFVPPKNDP